MIFKSWGIDHCAVLGGMLLAAVCFALNARTLAKNPFGLKIRAALALLILLLGAGDCLQQWQRGYNVIPLQLCDLALILTALTWLFPKNRGAGEVAVLWALSGSVQAALTPDLSEGFPSIPWFFFFGTHAAVILSAVYFLAAGTVKLTRGSVLRASLWTIFYAAAISLFNWRFHFNYGYLSAKPGHASLLDYLGPWPYYIFVEGLMALGLFFLILQLGRWTEARRGA